VFGETYPVYRLLVIGFGTALAVYALVERSTLGSVVRATVADGAEEKTTCPGGNISSRDPAIDLCVARPAARALESVPILGLSAQSGKSGTEIPWSRPRSTARVMAADPNRSRMSSRAVSSAAVVAWSNGSVS
jgi:hypothetical protein